MKKTDNRHLGSEDSREGTQQVQSPEAGECLAFLRGSKEVSLKAKNIRI